MAVFVCQKLCHNQGVKNRGWLTSFDTMKIGYARVSTTDQNIELQTDALEEAGCEKIFSDREVSGAKAERPGLDKALDHIRKKDTLVICKLDRLGRSLSDLLSIVEGLKEKGANFASIQDGFDTSTASGKMVFSVMGFE